MAYHTIRSMAMLSLKYRRKKNTLLYMLKEGGLCMEWIEFAEGPALKALVHRLRITAICYTISAAGQTTALLHEA